VQPSWHEARQSLGHTTHVVQEKIPCTSCHELEASKIGSTSPKRCAVCHEHEALLEHAASRALAEFGAGTSAVCTDCHAFGVERPLFGESVPLTHERHEPGDCARCHAFDQGDIPAVRVHETERCTECHVPHQQDAPEPAPCTGCHDQGSAHTAHGEGETAACTVCHQHQHAPASEARESCVDCHSQHAVVPASALFESGHRECVGCHRPHDFEKSRAEPCATCHAGVHVLGGKRVAQHQVCTNCHAPHDAQKSAASACTNCHAKLTPDHPKHGPGAGCTDCHVAHPSSDQAPLTRSCSNCHQQAAHEHDFHTGIACTQCHQPHDFVRDLSDRRSCLSCHQQELSRASQQPGHQACESCHAGLPHRPSALTAGCGSCHENEHKSVTRGHGECTTCHEPHAGALVKECSACHQNEHRSAPAGHQQCIQCHSAHSGAEHATCTSCHRSEASTPHAKIAGGCDNCHRPHGPGGIATPKPCASCHELGGLPGLHAVTKHQACARCHTGHGDATPIAARDACLNCHQDKKQHFPDAPRCANCHLFGHTR
jgi:hypothetical protein